MHASFFAYLKCLLTHSRQLLMASKRRRSVATPVPAKRGKREGTKVALPLSGWVWNTGDTDDRQTPIKRGVRTYYHHATFMDGAVPMRITVEDIVATDVEASDEETRELNLQYWLGQVGALYEEKGAKYFVLRFFDQAEQWRYMNSDDARMMKAFGSSFRKDEVLETDVCCENPIEIIKGKVVWLGTQEEVENFDKKKVRSKNAFPSAVFSDRMIVRCGANGVRRSDLTDSLWPAPMHRRRNRLLLQCSESVCSIAAGETKTTPTPMLTSEAHVRAIEALKLSVLPENLPCRESETATIREFLKTAVKSTGQSGNVLYISGVPGTGKTSSVLSVVKSVQASTQFDFVHINSMKLNAPTDLFRYAKTVLKNACTL